MSDEEVQMEESDNQDIMGVDQVFVLAVIMLHASFTASNEKRFVLQVPHLMTTSGEKQSPNHSIGIISKLIDNNINLTNLLK